MPDKLHLKLPPIGALAPANSEDPLGYYYKPFVGWFYRQRIDTGLALLSYPVENVLDVGCGSGILAPALLDACSHYVGIDTQLAKIPAYLEHLGGKAVFKEMDICKTDFPDDSFDAIMMFSIFEHMRDLASAVSEVKRILKPGGQCIAGFPMVNLFMQWCFRLIGFGRAGECHINDSSRIIKAVSSALKISRIKTIPPGAHHSLALYTCIKATKA
ncbi:MAG: class I SAM-dependent methyltransferase [Candidatus Omnitrophica bacterium]|nr:class I SAM-dependent methyltransferase [Candidatus Omnitrophota bacterium]